MSKKDHTPSTFARRVGLECENFWVRLKGILVEQDSEVRVAGVRHELIGDVRNIITGFLKNNRMKLPTGSGDNVGRMSARPAWIPLKKGKAKLMMHEIAVSCIKTSMPFRFGLTEVDQRKNESTRFRKRNRSCTRICTDRIVSSHKGGACTPFGAGSCACRVCSHLSGTDRRLLGMAGRTVSRRTMCSKLVRVSSKIRRRGWLFESWRRLQQGTWTLY